MPRESQADFEKRPRSTVVASTTDCGPNSDTEDPICELTNVSSHGSSSYYVSARITTVDILCLIDTGCTANVLSKTVYDRLAKRIQDTLESYNSHGLLADGSTLPIYGKIRLNVVVRGLQFDVVFLVGKIRDDVILGIPFLEDNCCRMNFGETTLEVRG